MEELDPVIHQPTRLRIISTLAGMGKKTEADFPLLKKLLNLTDGNLGIHLQKLEEAGYVRIDKRFVNKKPRTYVIITDEGSRAFGRYVSYLESIIKTSK